MDAYNQSIETVSSTMRRYSNCVANSEGKDDCSLEFRRLRNAQSDFETAVGQIGMECRS